MRYQPRSKSSPVDLDTDDMELLTEDVMTTAMARSAGGRSRAHFEDFGEDDATCVRPSHFVPAPPPRSSIPAPPASLAPMEMPSVASGTFDAVSSRSAKTVKLALPKKRTTWMVSLGLAYAAIGAAAIVMLHARGAEHSKLDAQSGEGVSVVHQASQQVAPPAAMVLQAPAVPAQAVSRRIAPAPQAPVMQMAAVEMTSPAMVQKPKPENRWNWKHAAPVPAPQAVVVAKKPEPKPEPKPIAVPEETRMAVAKAPEPKAAPLAKSSVVADANALAEAQLGDGSPVKAAKKPGKTQNAALATLNAGKATADDAL